MNDRLERVRAWAGRTLPGRVLDIAPASADASFRDYFRVRWPGGSAIVMDAPPAHEDCRPFVRIAGALAQLGLNVPRVLAADIGAGLLLLSDLGDTQYLDKLGDATADRLYGDALDALARLALGGDPASGVLPPYDDALLLREMNLFRDWFLVRHLGLTLDGTEHALLDTTFALLSEKARAQPQVWVHRDYHSRNLMVCAPHDPGVLDFQDAVIGAVTYDLVSLLRDAYIDWPDARVAGWVESYRQRLAGSVLARASADAFLRDFELMGAQRQLKVCGIFARLAWRDGKHRYLADIPRVFEYLLGACARHPELAGLGRFLHARVVPALAGETA